ncbi:MAG TPA: DNA-binding response regulator [Clostridiales bacterium]|nr:DNA-binding response regulator [Clostridiales bacterium]
MIYVVEDDKSIRELVAYAMDSAGYEAETFGTARSFFAAMNPSAARLVILDIMLPGEDGLTVLSRLRSAPETAQIPVIIMSALGTERDKVHGLDLGADDYIAKPFGIKEFLARVRAQLRRHEPKALLTSGRLRLHPAGRKVEVGGQEISLTAKEFELLEYLMRRAGVAVRREELLGVVWGYSGGEETRTVDVHIRSLRSKLGASGNAIETVRGVGYRMEKQL